MADLERIERVLILKKRAAEQDLARQISIELSIRRDLAAVEASFSHAESRINPDQPGVAEMPDLQVTSRWLLYLQQRKSNLGASLRKVENEIEKLRIRLGDLTGQQSLISRRLKEMQRTKKLKKIVEHDNQRLENWRLNRGAKQARDK